MRLLTLSFIAYKVILPTDFISSQCLVSTWPNLEKTLYKHLCHKLLDTQSWYQLVLNISLIQEVNSFEALSFLNIGVILFFLSLYKQACKHKAQRGLHTRWCLEHTCTLTISFKHMTVITWILNFCKSHYWRLYLWNYREISTPMHWGNYSISFSKTKTNMTKIAPYFIILPIICSKEN